MKLKLSPLWLFLLLLIVLIASTIFMKPYAAISKESFIGFYGSTASNTAGLTIPNYPNPVIKLYDNDFFDPLNGNLLRVYAAAYDAKAGPDNTGATIDHIDVIDRSGKSTSFKGGKPITANSLTTVPNSYLSWTAYSTDTGYSNITSDQVLYCAWGQDTYIHVFDLNNNLNACGFLYSSGAPPIYTNFNATLPKLGQAAADNNTYNNTYAIDNEFKDVVCYQLTSYITYMPTIGYLRIKEKDGTSTVYNRDGQTVQSFSPTDTIQPSTTPWIETDLVGNHLVIYIPNQTKTTIVVLKLSSDNVSYTIVSVNRFNGDGSLQKDANTIIPIPIDLKTIGGDGSGIIGGGITPAGGANGLYGNLISSFNRNFTADEQANMMDNMMRSFKSVIGSGTIGGGVGIGGDAGAGDVNYTNQQISDYILKTQIVPPICPASPACPSCPQFPAGTTCTSCGSPGGAGPVAAPAPAAIAAAPAPARAGSPTSGTPSGIYRGLKEAGSETKGLITSTGSGTADLLRKTGSGTKNLLEEAGSGGKQILEETAGGVTGLAKEAASGAVGLTRSALQGTVGAVRGIGSDVAGLFKEDRAQVGVQGGGQYGVSGTGGAGGAGAGGVSTGAYGQGAQGPQNPWNYNGALTDRGSSTFIPVLTDFSKFSH